MMGARTEISQQGCCPLAVKHSRSLKSTSRLRVNPRRDAQSARHEGVPKSTLKPIIPVRALHGREPRLVRSPMWH